MVITDFYERMFVYWFSRLVVQFKWRDAISQSIIKLKRQDKMICHRLFYNVFDQKIIYELPHIRSRICTNNEA